MTGVRQYLKLLVISLAGWFSRYQKAVIDYLVEEIRFLNDQLDGQRLRSAMSSGYDWP